MTGLRALLVDVAATGAFRILLGFVAGYPLVTASLWIVTALCYRAGRERPAHDDFYALADEELPPISLLVPAYREGAGLDRTLAGLHALDYPDYEVLVIDDGSPDRTAQVARAHLADRRFRLLRKRANEGKAMAMNDALPVARGEILVVVDADAQLAPDALRHVAAHFVRLPRVAAVTGNPRVANRRTLLAQLQTLEFTSIVSILRRAQVVWGRVLTVSGVISAVRRSALEDVGLFDPSKATEDIDVSWRLQRRYYDIRYEPRALVAMTVPASLPALWRQRRRWAAGLVEVLRDHAGILVAWRARRLWPVLVEALASIAWAHAFVGLAAFWALDLAVGLPPAGARPIPNTWGMTIATVCLLQLMVGVRLDARYDPGVRRSLLLAPVYPLVYWMLMSLCTVRSTLPAVLRRRPSVARWHSRREVTEIAGSGEPAYAEAS